ncbi:MAG: helix-turn-helix domain-containing protein [Cyanobacteria bacterium REEB67]|nr:helix-turn-helix domain-containing protein [Cyanobacteria bacterium REEB67]
MSQAPYSIQPTVKQLLASDALAEAQVLFGDQLLNAPVSQVISTVGPGPRPGSLVVTRNDSLSAPEVTALSQLSALVLVKGTPDFVQSNVSAAAAGAAGLTASGAEVEAARLASLNDAGVKRLIKRCSEAKVPLILVPSYGDPAQVIEDVRFVFLRELKLSAARLSSIMLSIVLEEGLDGLIETVSAWLNRPLVVENADFKVLASRNMGVTPANQQKHLTDEGVTSLRAYKKSMGQLSPGISPLSEVNLDVHMSPIKLGRRLVFPVPLSEVIVGYVSVMIRPQDDLAALSEYMHPLALACKVDFSHRLKDSPSFSVTQKTLLKDLLSGRPLSAADQERLDRHFGFDLCDGFFVFAVDATYPDEPPSANAVAGAVIPPLVTYPDEGFISCEAEGMRAFVVPYNAKTTAPWGELAQAVVDKIKELNPGVNVRLGSARLIDTALDLPDAYGEARQALVIGSMIHEGGDFQLGYQELGVKRLLYLIIDHPEVDRFLLENLSPLESYDEEWESELVDSLRVYLQHGANLNSAARGLFIHRHTLRYRLEQIADILKVDIDSQEVLLNLQVTFLIRDMKTGLKKR